MNNVVLVAFKESPDYVKERIDTMYSMLKRNLSVPFEFVVLTNEKVNYPSVPYDPNYIKWWMKMGMFKPGLFTGKRVLFIDLGMVIINPIDALFNAQEPFLMNRGFTGRWEQRDSSVMLFNGDDLLLCDMFEYFAKNAKKTIVTYPTDQEYIEKYLTLAKNAGRGDYLSIVTQDYIAVNSYKKHIRNKSFSDEWFDIVSFHGHPKPWEVNERWVEQYYK